LKKDAMSADVFSCTTPQSFLVVERLNRTSRTFLGHVNLHLSADLPYTCQEFAKERPVLVDLTGEKSLIFYGSVREAANRQDLATLQKKVEALSIVRWTS
jgi:hypothetical protein